jgi:hypothetical protein
MGYCGAGGKLIHKKNQKQKISWHCPFKLLAPTSCTNSSSCTTVFQDLHTVLYCLHSVMWCDVLSKGMDSTPHYLLPCGVLEHGIRLDGALFTLCCHVMFLSMGLDSTQHYLHCVGMWCSWAWDWTLRSTTYIVSPCDDLEHGIGLYAALITLCRHVVFLSTGFDSTRHYSHCVAIWCSWEWDWTLCCICTYIVSPCDVLEQGIGLYAAIYVLTLCRHVIFLSTGLDSMQH